MNNIVRTSEKYLSKTTQSIYSS